MHYDLLIIGRERDGLERAISAARMGRLVAVVDVVDVSPSIELLQGAVDHVVMSRDVTIEAWRTEVERLIAGQSLADLAEMDRWGIEQISGVARFVSETSLEVVANGERRLVSATEIVVACGTRSRRPASLRWDGRFVLDAESLLKLDDIPRSAIVVGAGSTGLKGAILLAKLGVEVSVVDEHVSLLDICGRLDDSYDAVQSLDIAFRLGDEAIGTQLQPDQQVAVHMSSGRVLTADVVIVCVGREGITESLNLEAAGVGLDEHGRVWCDRNGQTWAPNIIAAGDVIGFPRPKFTRRKMERGMPA